jgi:hypothetical protein
MESTHSIESSSNGARWPTCAIWMWGTLGGESGRRYNRRASIALVIMALALAGTAAGKWKPLLAITPGFAFLYIVHEFRKYVAEQDELGRGIMFEAMAWTYVTAGVLAMFAGGIVMAYGLRFDPLWAILGLIMIEPLRAVFLYRVVRRYQ